MPHKDTITNRRTHTTYIRNGYRLKEVGFFGERQSTFLVDQDQCDIEAYLKDFKKKLSPTLSMLEKLQCVSERRRLLFDHRHMLSELLSDQLAPHFTEAQEAMPNAAGADVLKSALSEAIKSFGLHFVQAKFPLLSSAFVLSQAMMAAGKNVSAYYSHYDSAQSICAYGSCHELIHVHSNPEAFFSVGVGVNAEHTFTSCHFVDPVSAAHPSMVLSCLNNDTIATWASTHVKGIQHFSNYELKGLASFAVVNGYEINLVLPNGIIQSLSPDAKSALTRLAQDCAYVPADMFTKTNSSYSFRALPQAIADTAEQVTSRISPAVLAISASVAVSAALVEFLLYHRRQGRDSSERNNNRFTP